MHSKDIAPPPTSINEEIPKGLEQIIIKAMEKDPNKRFQSASEMIQALQMFRKDPDIIFNYDEEVTPVIEEEKEEYVPVPVTVNSDGSTEGAYSNTGEVAVAPNTPLTPQPPEEEEIDEDEIEVERSFFLPVLTGITLVIILVAVIFVASLIKDAFGSKGWENPEFTMPNLVGYDYKEAKSLYTELDISVSAEQYSETYPKDTIMEQNVDEGTLCRSGVSVDVVISKGVKMVTVPDVVNFDYNVAEQTLKNEGLLVEMKFQWDDDVDKDLVVKTEPSAKEEVAPGTKVVLYVSNGRYVSVVKVPDLTGYTLDAAKAMVESKDLTWKLVYQDSDQPKDIVIDQSIQPDTEVDSKTEITLYLSNGTPPTNSVTVQFTIPDNATGTFTFQIYIDSKLNTEKTGVVASMGNGTTSMVLEGNGTQLVTVMLINEANGKAAEYGRYNINFDDPSQQPEVISSKITQAFIDVDGVVVQTETVQQQIVYNTETEAPSYEQPAETEAPAQEQVDDSNDDYQEDNQLLDDSNDYGDNADDQY
jgi:serine/threonine-protein kinase